MSTLRTASVAAVAALALVAPTPPLAAEVRAQRTIERSFEPAGEPLRRLQIDNVFGSIRVVAHDEPTVRLVAHEVVVADDGSSHAPQVPRGVRLVRQADDGFRAAAARNLGVAASTGDLLVLLDADTVPEPHFVERMVALPEALPEALVVGRRRHADLAGTSPGGAIEEVAPPREIPEPAWLREAYDASRDRTSGSVTKTSPEASTVGAGPMTSRSCGS